MHSSYNSPIGINRLNDFLMQKIDEKRKSNTAFQGNKRRDFEEVFHQKMDLSINKFIVAINSLFI